MVQQTNGGQAAPQAFNAAERSNALEAEADRAATEAAQGRPAAIRMRAPAGTTQAFDVSEQADESPAPEAEKPAASPAPRAKKPAISSAPKADEPAASAEAAGITDIESEPAGGGGDAGSASGTSGADAALLLPEAPAALSAAARRRLAVVKANAKTAGQAAAALPTANTTTAQARGAVEEPQVEQDARAEAGVVEQLDERPAPSATIEQACKRIRGIIKGKRPADEDSLVDAKPREMARQAGGQVNKQVESRAGAVSDGYDALAGEPAGQPSRAPVPAKAPPEKVALPDMNAASGAPDALGEQDVSLDADVAQQQQGIDAAGMNTEPAKLVKDGPIAEARAAMGDLEAEAQTGPQAVLAEQTAAIAAAKGDMGALQEKAARALADARSGTVSNVKGLSVDTTASEEQQRAQVGVQMQAIFAGARTQVDELLAPLSDKALRRWNSGVKRLAGEFESSLAQVKAKIAERYESDDNWWNKGKALATEISDKAFGLPRWVEDEYDTAEKAFADGCCALARDISRDVNQVIESCEKIIEQARTDIDQHVASLPDDLKKWATGEATKIGKKLASLQSKVGETRQSLDQDLVDRANQAVQEVRERVQELREAAKGVVGRIADALDEFLENPGRAIVNGLLNVVGIPPARFWSLVDKLGDVVAGIAADPMGFANNLMKGVGQGFQQFFGNFPRHLLQGVMDWLFSRLGEAGVRMPIDFSLPSVITLFLEVMGITWARIRKLLAKHAGEDNVALIEQAMGLVVPLIELGPQGIFEMIKEQLEPKVILDAVIETVIDYLTTALITQVMPKIIAMLNPAGAILKAIEAIWKTISWLFENAAKLFTLVEAVVNGAADLLSGNVSGMANAVEFALAGLLGPVIGFLADIIGLSGVPEAVKNAILGLQERVEKILDKVISWLAKKAKALLQRKGAPAEGTDEEKHAKMGKAAAREMEKEPAEAMPYEKLRAHKEAQAREIEAKYNQQLEKSVKMTIRFRSAEEDMADGDLDFHIHIGPNDFDMDGAVEGVGQGTGPEVGTYAALYGKHEGKEAHHAPPKGLLAWMKAQADATEKRMSEDEKDAYPWIVKLAALDSSVWKPGNTLAAISVDNNTHIKKNDTNSDAYRIHWGHETAREVFRRLNGEKGLRLIYRMKYEQLDPDDKKRYLELANEAGESVTSISEEEKKALEKKGGSSALSTQFFKAELDMALKLEQEERGDDVQKFEDSLGSVAHGAHRQSHEAVVVALENSNRDGTKEQRRDAISELDKESERTWKQHLPDEVGDKMF